MPRHNLTLHDATRRRVGDLVLEARVYHLRQAEKRRADAAGLTRRYHEQIRTLRNELEYHARQAADAREISEALS